MSFQGRFIGLWAGSWFGAVTSGTPAPAATAHGKPRRRQPRKRGRFEVDSFSDWVVEPPPPDDNEFLIIAMMTR